MSDLVNGVRHIGPSYPVKPVQPAVKERKPGEKHKKPPNRKVNPTDDDNDDSNEHPPTIDELV